jgi:hypothetical protein
MYERMLNREIKPSRADMDRVTGSGGAGQRCGNSLPDGCLGRDNRRIMECLQDCAFAHDFR